MSINIDVFEKYALKLLAEGFLIVPCYHNNPYQDFKEVNKTKPLLPRGWNAYRNNSHAISRPDQLSGVNYQNMISAMVVVPPGFVVLDLDRKDEAQAVLANQVLTELKPHLPRTLVVKTASGGYHFYYRTERKLNVSAYRGCIDVQQESLRGKGAGKTGKGVWAPGCVRDGVGEYAIAIDADIAELPEATIELLEDRVATTVADGTDATSLVTEVEAIDLWPERIPKGDRNTALYRICGSYYGRGIPKHVARKIMAALVADCVDNSDGEIDDDTIESMVERTYSEDNELPDRSVDILTYCLDRFIHEKANNRVIDLDDGSVHKFVNALRVFGNFLYEVQVGEKSKLLNAIDVWSKHPKKRVVSYVGYRPRAGLVYTCPRLGVQMYNTYYEPELYDGQVDKEDGEECWKQFRFLCEHLVPEMPEYLVNYAAHMVQHPAKKLSVATVIFSEHRGVGKNLYFDILSNLVGRSNSVAGNINDFLGQFNYQFATSHNILVDEAEHRPTANQMARFKSLITEDFVRIEQKGIDSYTIPAYFNFLIFANRMDQFPVEVGDRRFNMFVCPNKGISIERLRVLSRLGTNKAGHPEGLNLPGLKYLFDKLMQYEIDTALFSGLSRSIETATKQFVREGSLSEIVQDLLHDVRQKIGAFSGDIITKQSIKAHAARFHSHEMTESEMKDFLYNSGQIAKLPYHKNTYQPRMVTLSQFYVDRLMYLRSDSTRGVYCFVCRNFDHYTAQTDLEVIKVEYMKGYDAVTSIGGDNTVPMIESDAIEVSSKVH